MNYTLNIKGQLLSLEKPVVMGILNATPDSFYASSRQQAESDIRRRAREIIEQGGKIIDVGAYSTRPGHEEITQEEEMARLRTALKAVNKEVADAIISVDTFRPDVARMVVEEYGAAIINDVSEGYQSLDILKGEISKPIQANGNKAKGEYNQSLQGDDADTFDTTMFRMVARLGVPYILMSLQPDLRSTLMMFAKKVQLLRDMGQKDIILDPGFGFGKTLEQNFQLYNELEKLSVMELPLLVGISRKSMIFKLLDCTPNESLNGTSVLNTIAIMKGASILRVHDVKEAVECCKITSQFSKK